MARCPANKAWSTNASRLSGRASPLDARLSKDARAGRIRTGTDQPPPTRIDSPVRGSCASASRPSVADSTERLSHSVRSIDHRTCEPVALSPKIRPRSTSTLVLSCSSGHSGVHATIKSPAHPRIRAKPTRRCQAASAGASFSHSSPAKPRMVMVVDVGGRDAYSRFGLDAGT